MSTNPYINNPIGSINPVFFPVWLSKKNHIMLKGGRSSTKSSVISQKLVSKKMRYPMSNIVCFRQVATTLQKSVYSQISWALHESGVADQFIFQKNPLQIIHKKWGTGFHFSGADDPEKLKSLKIPVGYVSDLWLEEMDSFKGEEYIDKIEDTFIRNDLPDGLQVTVWGSWNPPRNPYAWINEYVEKHRNDDDFLIHHSTYLDDKLHHNSDQIVKKIEKYKKNDFDYYRWMYLGHVIGLGTNVYNMDLFQIIDQLPVDDYIKNLYFSIDAGHQVSATSCGAYALTAKGNIIKLDTFYYSPAGRVRKKAPSELAKDIHEFMKSIEDRYKRPVKKQTIDSAEGGLRNQFELDFSLKLHPVAKKEKTTMIDYTHDLLAQGRFFVLKSKGKQHGEFSGANDIFIDECKMYSWDEKTVQSDKPQVIKENDHSVDEFQYACVDNAKEWGLKKKKGGVSVWK